MAAPIDLFAWPRLHEAEDRVRAAMEARAEALRKYRYAPRGQVRDREAAFQTATAEELKAEAELAALRRELGDR